MASKSICPRCGNSTFEMAPAVIEGAKFQLQFVRCASCGCVVGTVEGRNIGDLIRRLAEKLNIDI